MRIVLDTNVFISGVFFSGPPFHILKAWRDRKIQIALSEEILQEYQQDGETLTARHPGVHLGSVLGLLSVEAGLFFSPDLPNPVCEDRTDDKFLACALAARARIVVSGDRHLLKVNDYRGIEVIRPQEFVHRYLKGQS